MNKLDYFLYSLKQDFLLKLNWYFTFFAIFIDSKNTNPYYRVLGEKKQVNVNGEWVDVEGVSNDEPVFKMSDIIKLPSNTLLNQTEEVETTIGRAIANKVLLEFCFGSKIPYINKPFSISKLEEIIAENMRTDKVIVDEYLKFTNSVIFIKGLSRIVNVSATPKNILPPPGINEFKKELINTYNKNFGNDWVNDRVKVLEFKEELKKKDKEWLADDPSRGKLLTKKITDNARVKMFLTFGDEVGFDKTSGKMTFVPNALSEQYPSDKKQLTAMFNSSRSGSYDRGKETQKGGATAKDLLRSISSYKIVKGDCGSTNGKDMEVTNVNADSLNGRYQVVGSNTVKIEKGSDFIGKTIKLRSPMFCLSKGSSFCSVCCGDSLSLQPDGISLVILNISDIILATSMKSMHNSQVQTTDADMQSMIK